MTDEIREYRNILEDHVYALLPGIPMGDYYGKILARALAALDYVDKDMMFLAKWNAKKIEIDKDVPLRDKYKKILEKIGYVRPIADPFEHLVYGHYGEKITLDLIRKVKEEIQATQVYNPFFDLANMSPAPTSRIFEELLLSAGATRGVKIIRPRTNRYDLEVYPTGARIEVKVGRLIDVSEPKKPKTERFMTYGMGNRFSLGIKQVKLKYFDYLIFVVVATNIALYMVFEREDIERIIRKSFVNREKIGVPVSVVHNVENVPDDREGREKLLYNSEFNIYVRSYSALKALSSFARVVTFYPMDVIEYIRKKEYTPEIIIRLGEEAWQELMKEWSEIKKQLSLNDFVECKPPRVTTKRMRLLVSKRKKRRR